MVIPNKDCGYWNLIMSGVTLSQLYSFGLSSQVKTNRSKHIFPAVRRRINQFKMLAIGQCYQLTWLRQLFSPLEVTLTDFDGYGCVGGSVNQRVWCADGQQFYRRTGHISFGHLCKATAEKLLNNSFAKVEFGTSDQVNRTGQRDSALKPQRRIDKQCVLFHELVAGCSPKCKGASGGKAYGDDPAKIQVKPGRDLSQVIDCEASIKKSSRPSASSFSYSSILDIPSCETVSGECSTQVGMGFQSVGRTPPSSMNADDHGKGAGSIRNSEFAKLTLVFTIFKTKVMRRLRSSEQINRSFHSGAIIRSVVAIGNNAEINFRDREQH